MTLPEISATKKENEIAIMISKRCDFVNLLPAMANFVLHDSGVWQASNDQEAGLEYLTKSQCPRQIRVRLRYEAKEPRSDPRSLLTVML